MGIRILKGGMMTTVQDLGRYGYQSQGFSVAGVMDVRSFKIANLLLDNPENEAVLEITLIGPTLEFTSATIIAITGGDFQPTINDNEEDAIEQAQNMSDSDFDWSDFDDAQVVDNDDEWDKIEDE